LPSILSQDTREGGVELDEAYITTDREESKSMGEKCKRGSGSERK